jgi:hypothetical protein
MQVNMYNRLKTLIRGEELKWRHRSKEKQKEIGNAKYFHIKSSGKEDPIVGLQHNREETLGDADLRTYVTNFYKNLFGTSTITKYEVWGG